MRLQVVKDYLPRAALEADADIENVHQLRVGTRRSDAALRIFADCLSKKVYRKARQRLKKLRPPPALPAIGTFFSPNYWPANRTPTLSIAEDSISSSDMPSVSALRAHAELESVHREESSTFESFLVHTIEAIRPPEEPSCPAILVDLARPMLFDRLKELEQAALSDLSDYAQLHRARIAGKRLRYAMEVFADCFDPAFRDTLYPH